MPKPRISSNDPEVVRLLVIDDDPIIREILHQFFSNEYECDTAERAEQALEVLDYQQYDAIITDISMPVVGGVQILM